MDRETVSPDKAPIFRKWYGVRDEYGNINGRIHGRWLLSDILKGLIVALLLAVIMGGKDAYNWYQRNKDLPEKFDRHCNQQVESERKLAESLGEIKEGIRDLQRRR